MTNLGKMQVSPHGDFGASSQNKKTMTVNHSATASPLKASTMQPTLGRKNEVRFRASTSSDS